MSASERVIDGRGDRLADARYCILPGRSADDKRLSGLHYRLLSHIGRSNQNKGWCRLSQTEMAERWGVRRQSISRAGKELVEWGYIEKLSQVESGESFCLYRVIIDHPGVQPTGDTPPGEGVQPTGDTGGPLPVAPVSPRKDTLTIKRSSDHPPVVPQRGDRAHRLPDDFVVPDEWRTWAAKHSPANVARIAAEAEKFIDHWRATGGRKVDWQATWRNWWRRACEQAGRAPVPVRPPERHAHAFAAAVAHRPPPQTAASDPPADKLVRPEQLRELARSIRAAAAQMEMPK
ncbi:MAG TPA: helix-turn-helix domain-containing protein [Hyphomicrobiaceae bacterium]|nr:helix-turn-helix domain-containing protein [Hyphomicrobiaceae bacterium]